MKTQNQQRIIGIIASYMTDYQVDLYGLRLLFVPWLAHGTIGQHRFGQMSVAVCEIAWHLVKAKKLNDGSLSFGADFIRAIAHEFRHSQQAALWETDIPQVSFLACVDIFCEAYEQDAGEKDARAFSELVINQVPQEFVRKMDRLARWIGRHQWSEYHRQETAYRACTTS